MKGYGLETYGELIADLYDDWFPSGTDGAPTAEAVDFLARRAGAGPALELGIGTGRVALPLAERGIEVHGIDASEAMVSRLRAKPGGDRVSISMGDFADVSVPGRFSLIYVVFNTLFALLTQEDQVRCFHNVASHLTRDGIFVVEAFVPDLTRFTADQTMRVHDVALDQVIVEASRHDALSQRVVSQNLIIRESGIRLSPTLIRYAWPSELDLMARLAGLKLRERWAGWDQAPFTAHSQSHVSVYGQASGEAG